jgi:hypothetical protein
MKERFDRTALPGSKRKLDVNWDDANNFKPAIHQKAFRRCATIIVPRGICLKNRASVLATS